MYVKILNNSLFIPFTIINKSGEKIINVIINKISKPRRLSRFLTIDFPGLKKSLITAFCVSSILSASDLVVISFFGTNNLSTLTQTIYRLMGSYRINEAYSVSLILLIFCFIYFFLVHKILEKNKWNIH